jgi:hypothetical protein
MTPDLLFDYIFSAGLAVVMIAAIFQAGQEHVP